MALSTTFNRLKREIGIKKCVIVEGNVGDVYLNDKKQIVDLKQYLMDMLKAMDYDDCSIGIGSTAWTVTYQDLTLSIR